MASGHARTSALALAVCSTFLAMVCSACVAPTTPRTPGDGDWRRIARTTVGDVAAQLGTVVLVLKGREKDDFFGRYAVVTLAAAEDAAGRSISGFESQQPPAAESKRATEVGGVLDRASSLIQDTREAVVAHDTGVCSDYCRKLTRLSTALQDLEDQLKKPAGR